MFRKRDELLAPAHMRAIQEELAAFFLDHVIAEDGEYYVDHASVVKDIIFVRDNYCIYVAGSVG